MIHSPHLLERPLDVVEDVSLTSRQHNMLRALEDYDVWFVAERLEKEGAIPSDQIDEAIQEFKKYLALSGLGYHDLWMISEAIDEVWHTFILFTREYAQFCDQVFGRFIHHTPATSRRPLTPGGRAAFIDAYSEVFGELPEVWHSNRTGCGGDPPKADCSECE